MRPERHIKKFYDRLHHLTMDGLIDAPDKYVAFKDIEIAVHHLRQAFERSGQIKLPKQHDP